MSTKEKKLSRNYRGCSRSNRRYSEQEKLGRRTKSILSKLTPEKLPRLLPKIIAIYIDVKDKNTLRTFLAVIFDCVTATNLFHAQYIEILNELLCIDKSTISAADLKQCVLKLSEQYFETRMKSSQINGADLGAGFRFLDDYEWFGLGQKMPLLSMSKFIGKLTASKIMDFGTSINYLKMLFEDEKNENNIEAVCCIFTEIYEFISYDKRIALRNVQMDAIDVSMKCHLLVYGYAHGYYNNYIPRCVVDFCIGYYDTECYLFKYYQTLQRIGKDNKNYGMRIRMLIQNIIQMRMNSN